MLYSTASSGGGETVWDPNATASCGSFFATNCGNSGPPPELADLHPFQGWLFASYFFQRFKFSGQPPTPTPHLLLSSHVTLAAVTANFDRHLSFGQCGDETVSPGEHQSPPGVIYQAQNNCETLLRCLFFLLCFLTFAVLDLVKGIASIFCRTCFLTIYGAGLKNMKGLRRHVCGGSAETSGAKLAK